MVKEANIDLRAFQLLLVVVMLLGLRPQIKVHALGPASPFAASRCECV